MENKEYAYWLAKGERIGIVKVNKLLEYFGCAERIYKATEAEIMKSGALNKKDVEILCDLRRSDSFRRELEENEKAGIKFTYYADENYPEKLMNITDPPFSLFYYGELPENDRLSVAVVGARNADYECLQTAEKFATEMAEHNIRVISGLARGIDVNAHIGALKVKGAKTYGILGCGVDICYPRENFRVYEEMKERGGVISEFVPRTSPIARNFPMRNRIISGFSDAVLIVGAGKKSGSLITANLALDQGKDIFVIPGSIHNPHYAGSNYLIKNGANVVTEIKDILDAFGIFLDNSTVDARNNRQKNLTEYEKKVYNILSLEPIHISEIVSASGLRIQDVTSILINLEIKDYIRDAGNQHYVVVLN